jgi:hypothetical protein
MKAEKYQISIESETGSSMKVRYGFGAAGEEVQRVLATPGTKSIRVRIEGQNPEVAFDAAKTWRLLDIKQRIKGLSFED